MTRTHTRRGLLAASGCALSLSLAGCSGVTRRDRSPPEYVIGALELVNAHDEPHDVVVFVTANGSAVFARSVHLPAATHGDSGVDSANRWWARPVEGPARYRVHATVDDRAPRTHAYAPSGDATPCVGAVLWIDRDEGALSFDETACDGLGTAD